MLFLQALLLLHVCAPLSTTVLYKMAYEQLNDIITSGVADSGP